MNIYLKSAVTDENTIIVRNMMQNENGIKDIFKNRLDRLGTAYCSWLVMVDDIEVGFVNLINEKLNYKFLSLDIGIKEEYRNKGICREVLKRLLEKNIKNFIIIETLEDNIGMNKVANSVSCKLETSGDKNYYLLQKDRLEEFIDCNGMELLSQHLETTSFKKLYVK